jgi:DNA-binding MarR family transcriptional regulator
MSDDGGALEDAAQALRELILAGEHYRQAVAGDLQVDISQTQAMSYLHTYGDLGQSELGAMLGYNTSSVTALVDRLERQDLAHRSPHPTDRRRSIVGLTDHGRAVMAGLGSTFVHAFDHISAEVLPDCVSSLRSITADLVLCAARVRRPQML